jgi:hypothetical protein
MAQKKINFQADNLFIEGMGNSLRSNLKNKNTAKRLLEGCIFLICLPPHCSLFVINNLWARVHKIVSRPRARTLSHQPIASLLASDDQYQFPCAPISFSGADLKMAFCVGEKLHAAEGTYKRIYACTRRQDARIRGNTRFFPNWIGVLDAHLVVLHQKEQCS